MTNVLGVLLLLAQTVNHDGTNGFDPSGIVVIAEAGRIEIDRGQSERFAKWLHEDPDKRASVVKYFVACALDERMVIHFEGWTWHGALGLAPDLQRPLDRLVADSPHGKKAASRVQLHLDPDQGRWVSACLMAHANMKGSHEYVSIRGNPPAWRKLGDGPSAGERWSMGYAEGVFFADLLNFNYTEEGTPSSSNPGASPSPADLEKSFTQSLNLPAAYAASNTWRPPNVALGRTLDFDHTTMVTSGNTTYAAARMIGPFNSTYAASSAAGPDPEYSADQVCTKNADRAETGPSFPRQVVIDCKGTAKTPASAVRRWRPLFVHLPRFANLDGGGPAQPNVIIQAVQEGTFEPSASECGCAECACPVGPAPAAALHPGPRSLRCGLRDCQRLVVVLRNAPALDAQNLQIDMEEKFTAIVRYRSPRPNPKADKKPPPRVPKALVEVMAETGTWLEVPGSWAATEDFRYLQVYPVKPRKDPEHSAGRVALKLRITGVGNGSDAPELDVAGFVPGKPWCSDRDDLLMQVCDADGVPAGVTTVRRVASTPP